MFIILILVAYCVFLKIQWDLEEACVLRTSKKHVKALGFAVEHPAGAFCSDKMTSLDFFDMYLFILMKFSQYLALQLRTAYLKTNSGQQGCVLRPCVLFDCLSE